MPLRGKLPQRSREVGSCLCKVCITGGRGTLTERTLASEQTAPPHSPHIKDEVSTRLTTEANYGFRTQVGSQVLGSALILNLNYQGDPLPLEEPQP